MIHTSSVRTGAISRLPQLLITKNLVLPFILASFRRWCMHPAQGARLYTYIYRICHSSPCPSVALPGRDFWAGVMGWEAASPWPTITMPEATFSAAALPGDSSTPELRSTDDAFQVSAVCIPYGPGHQATPMRSSKRS